MRNSSPLDYETLILLCVYCGEECFFSAGTTEELVYGAGVCGGCSKRTPPSKPTSK
jgi:hypothetical protein